MLVFSHRTKLPLCGYPTDSSDMQDPKTTKIPPTLPPSLLTNLTPPTTLLRNLSLENAPSTPPPSPVSSSSSSSSTPLPLTDFIQPSTNLNNSLSRDKVRWRSRRHTPYSRTHQTIVAEPPTWGQLKKLTHLAHTLTVDQHIPVNADTLFVAMLAIISCQPYRLLWALRLILPEKTDFLKGIPKVHTPLFPTCDKSPPEDSKSNQDWAMIDPSKGFPIWRNFIFRILNQAIQKVASDLHLAKLKNKKGGDAGSQAARAASLHPLPPA
nr:uncharacterized protein LOC111749408 isoform X1 [Loxodonta africana]